MSETKRALRRRVLAARARLDPETLRANSGAVAEVLRERCVGTIAAYVPFGSEPGSLAVLDHLRGRGISVLLPVPGPDWVGYDGTLRTGRFPEPVGVPLGPGALRQAGLVIVPALAVDRRGNRLGRGGGFYDRALVGVTAPIVALLHDGEVLERVPAEPHDRPVDAVITPSSGWQPLDRVDGEASDGAP
ncbi:MAG TPA: 5-formyltetrahydrofolate cyclo-ligase [Mycobacteriales bacterium]|nr:5-formyltetrahydrofolate cyclo-ligase [Mycobacteriales bacterium]